MITLLILLLIIAIIAIIIVLFYPKMSVNANARRNGINSDVWYAGQKLLQRCKRQNTYYPVNIPTLATASLASAYKYYLKTQSHSTKEEILAQFIVPVNVDTSFDIRRKSQAQTTGEVVENNKEKREFKNTAFLITSRNRIIYSHWTIYGDSSGSYNIDPRQFTIQQNKSLFDSEFYISPNSNNEQEILAHCPFFKGVAESVVNIVDSTQSKLSERSLEVDEEGRRIL